LDFIDLNCINHHSLAIRCANLSEPMAKSIDLIHPSFKAVSSSPQFNKQKPPWHRRGAIKSTTEKEQDNKIWLYVELWQYRHVIVTPPKQNMHKERATQQHESTHNTTQPTPNVQQRHRHIPAISSEYL